MKRLLLVTCGAAFCLAAAATEIGEGIRTGQRVLLEKTQDSDNAEAVQIITASFEHLLAVRGAGQPVTLRVTRDSVSGEAMLGAVVMVDESIAALPEDERLFQIAHELGHIELAHLERQIAIYRQYVGASVDDVYIARTLNAHALEFSPALQALELEADAYGQRLLLRVPDAEQGGIHTFERNGYVRADFSHPSSHERLLRLLTLLPVPPDLAALAH